MYGLKHGFPVVGVVVVLGALCLGAPSFSAAQTATAENAGTLEEAVDRMAEQIATYLKARKESAVMIGAFHGPSTASAGLKISQMLKEELPSRGIEIKKLNAMAVRGRFQQKRSGDMMTVQIVASMFDRNNAEVFEFRQRVKTQVVDDPEDVATLTGATVDTTTPAAKEKPAGDDPPPPEGGKSDDAAAPAKALAEAVEKPRVSLEGTVVSATPQSPYRVEILIKQPDGKYAPCAVSVEDGFAFVDLKVGQVYAVRIINLADHDVGVRLTIDGLNTLDFSENPAYKALGMWVIPRRTAAGPGVGVIKGWHRNDAVSDSFLITDLPDSEAAKLGLTTSAIGTITATFVPAWSAGEQPPAVERTGSKSKGTARGPAVRARTIPVQRFFGRTLLASVSIRYVKPDPGDLPPAN